MNQNQIPVRLMMVGTQDEMYPPAAPVKSIVGLGLLNFGAAIRTVFLALLFVVVVGLSEYVVTHYFVHSVKVVGISMVPTLEENGKYLVDYWSLHNRAPHHNDIVVFRDPGDHGLSVKRVVAVEGESILFKDGKVFLNGHELKEDYLMGNIRTFTYSQAKEQFITLGVGQYFLLGDNRPASIDSRVYGPVSRGDILGLVKLNDKFPL